MKRDSKCWKHNYLCVGENWRQDYPIGDCGDTKTLIAWVKHFFTDEADIVLKKLEYATEKTVCDYIYVRTGKRITKAR